MSSAATASASPSPSPSPSPFLRPDPRSFPALAENQPWEEMRFHLGTSGYSYAPWKGAFYPEKHKAAEMLPYYARRFPTVEINNTFYRMPTKELLAQWVLQVPAGFRFAIKMPQQLTHRQKLASPDTPATAAAFFDHLTALGSKCGPVLVQLPPFLRCDVARLASFVSLVPAGVQVAWEFRHASWLNDEVASVLRRAGEALCHAESDEEQPSFTPWGDWGYLRLRKTEYSDAELDAWAEKLLASPWKQVWIFFKHEDEGRGPALARELQKRLVAPPG